MENSWQHTKCNSSSNAFAFASTSTLLDNSSAQAEMNLSDEVHSRSVTMGITQNSVFCDSLSSTSYISGHPDLGSSFLALLSGPPLLLQYDYRELADQSQLATSSKFPVDNGFNSVVGNGLKGPPTSYGLLPHYTSKPTPQNSVNKCSVSSTYVASNINSSFVFHGGDQVAQLNSHNSNIATQIQGKTIDTSTGHGKWQCSFDLPEKLHHTNINSSQKLPVDVKSLGSTQSSVFSSDCPRVFCMGRSGDLLMSNTGLLSVVCSCHCLHLSITKFCEHSGLHGVNPGDAVRMYSGETIVQWRKLYFERLRITVPEDQSGWDWPVELSMTCHQLKSPAFNPIMSDNSASSHLLSSKDGILRPRQPFNDSISLEKPYTGKNFVTDFAYNNQQRNVQATGSSFKGFKGTLQGDLHDVVEKKIKDSDETRHWKMSTYYDGRSNVISQSFPAFNDTVILSTTSSVTFPALHNIRTCGKNYDVSRYDDAKDIIVDREASSSNIELRLGQPYQQSRIVGSPVSLLVGSNSLSSLANPVNSVSREKIIQKTANSDGKLGDGNFFHCAIGQSNSRKIEEQNQLNLGNNVSINSDAAFTLDTYKFNMAKSSVIPVLPYAEMLTEQSVHLKPVSNITNGREHFMSKPLCSYAHISSCNPVNLARKSNPIDKRKEFGIVAGGSYISTDSSISIYDQVGSSRDFAEVDERTCCSFPADHVKNIHTPELLHSLLDTSNNQKSLNSTEKIPGFGNEFTDLQLLSSQASYAGLSSASSTSRAHIPPVVQKQDGVGVNHHFLDENSRLIALRQIVELSKQQHTLFLLGKDHSVVDPGMSEIHANRHNITNKVGNYDLALKPYHCAYSDGMLYQNGILTPPTGFNNQSNMPTFPLTCKRTESQLSNNLQSLHNSMRSLNNSQPSKLIRCHPSSLSASNHCNCSCSAQPYSEGGNFHIGVTCSCNFHEEEKWKVNNGASSLVAPEAIPAEKIIPSNQTDVVNRYNTSDVFHAPQWKDVPRKIVGFGLICKEAPIKASDEGGNEEGQFENRADKHCGGDSRFLETSNISSGCSAPAIFQTSAEVNNMDSLTVEVADTGYVDNSIVDEGSGIEKCSLPDDAFESEKSPEFPRSHTSDLENDGSSSIFNNPSSRSLLDELKLLDSMTWKRGRNLFRTGHVDNYNRNTRKLPITVNIGKTNKSIKFSEEPYGNCSCQCKLKRGRSAFSSAYMFSHKRNRNELYGDTAYKCGYQVKSHGHAGSGEFHDAFTGSEYRTDWTSTAFSQPEMHSHTSALPLKSLMYDSLSSRKDPSCKQSSVAIKKVRPVVSGKYGEISNGLDDSFPKPPKIKSLSLILKTAHGSSISQRCKPKMTKTRELRRMVNEGKKVCVGNPKFKNLEDIRNCDTSFVKSTLLKDTACTARNISYDEIIMQNKEASSGHKKLRAKQKEVRKRSLYELFMEGKNSGPKNSSFNEISNGEKVLGVEREKPEGQLDGPIWAKLNRRIQGNECLPRSEMDELCCVCGGSNKSDINNLLECYQCSIRVHQACYGILRVPKGHWYCRPCQINSVDVACVLCGYGGGAMTRAHKSSVTVKGLLKAWTIDTEKTNLQIHMDAQKSLNCISNFKVQNSITLGVLDDTVKQWVHMVCGLWTPGTRCPNVDTMNAFDVSGAVRPRANVICTLCRRPGGSCIKCWVKDCSTQFHPWCAHQKGLLQIEVDGVDNENLGFYGRCILHARKGANGLVSRFADPVKGHGENEPTCARTEGYKGCKRDGFWHNHSGGSDGKGGCPVSQEQQNVWVYINKLKKFKKRPSYLLKVEVEHDCRKEYAHYKQAKGWKHLVVYKSTIHAFGLYTSQFILRGKMVVEYVGEIVGPRVADKREIEYQSGRRLQYKSACYFFRIDKEHIIDATRKGGIARFVNHSCLPNCVAKVISVKNEKKVVFFAQRDIFPGEEITYDYHFNHEDEGEKIPCFCDSKNCRRYLN